jgi:hypothetical protein
VKKFGDVVQYQRGKEAVNALVVQSNPQKDGEHLVVVYLDPAVASNSMAGAEVDKAIAKAFTPPLMGASTYGWKDLGIEEAQAVDAPSPDDSLHAALAKANDAAVEELKKCSDEIAKANDANQALQAKVTELETELANAATVKKEADDLIESLKKELGDTTEGRDRALQLLADQGKRAAEGEQHQG